MTEVFAYIIVGIFLFFIGVIILAGLILLLVIIGALLLMLFSAIASAFGLEQPK